ncbi:peptide-methionine (S)-S-oxide reductase [Vibrio sp. M260118]|uniref:peptide-methionine (S)-S-oxide reductase n=1 Tax=Vibrio sp. M260118 TaxID=3020896 RepID=UPI002F3F9060
MYQEIYIAGGCLWGVQEFFKHIPGVISTEAGRANGTSNTTASDYDGYAECVRTVFDPTRVSVEGLVSYLFEIIDPYSINQQGPDIGEKYRTGIYSECDQHLAAARRYIDQRDDRNSITLEINSTSHRDSFSCFCFDCCWLLGRPLAET